MRKNCTFSYLAHPGVSPHDVILVGPLLAAISVYIYGSHIGGISILLVVE